MQQLYCILLKRNYIAIHYLHRYLCHFESQVTCGAIFKVTVSIVILFEKKSAKLLIIWIHTTKGSRPLFRLTVHTIFSSSQTNTWANTTKQPL